MQLRTFPSQVEELARQWRGEVLTSMAWSRVEEVPPGGESEPFWVRSPEGYVGLAKPGTREPPVQVHPRAAHEKIAADLAFDLGLPVPPVILWERPREASRPQRSASISALAFLRANVWRAIPSTLAVRLLPRLATMASAMAVFDSWIANTDRQNSGNLLLSEDVSVNPPVLRVAYLDFANSLSYLWGMGARWRLEDVVAPYPTAVPLDSGAMGETLREIEQLPPARLREVVNRIPGRFLSEPHRNAILEGLLYRQSTIRRMMARMYPGVS